MKAFRSYCTCALLVSAFGAAKSDAAIVQLTFDELQNNEPIQNYYDGGFGGNGSGPGPSLGVQFVGDARALTRSNAGGTGNFTNNPSGTNTMYFLTTTPVMNYAAGFDTGFSLFYSLQTGFSATLSVYDGLNATGNLLGSVPLTSTPNPYNVWVQQAVAFSGTAKSIQFSGAANFVGFDNVTFGSTDASTVIPLPGAAVAGLALMGTMGAARGIKRLRQPVVG